MKIHRKIVGTVGLVAVGLIEIADKTNTIHQLLPDWLKPKLGEINFGLLAALGLYLLLSHEEKEPEAAQPQPPIEDKNENKNAGNASATGGSSTATGIGTLNVFPPEHKPQRQYRPPIEEPPHNVRYCGLKRIFTDGEKEVFDGSNGLIGIKASFLNKAIPNKKVGDFERVHSRVVFRTEEDDEGTTVDNPKWLSHESSRLIDIEVNHTECILLAMFDPNNKTWMVPFISQTSTNWSGMMDIIDGFELPIGIITVELTLVGKDSVGLETVTSTFAIDAKGNAEVKPQ